MAKDDGLQPTYAERFRKLTKEERQDIAVSLIDALLEMWDRAIADGGFVALGTNKYHNQLSVVLCKSKTTVNAYSRTLRSLAGTINDALNDEFSIDDSL